MNFSCDASRRKHAPNGHSPAMSHARPASSVPAISDALAQIRACLAQMEGLQASIRVQIDRLSSAPLADEPLTLTVEEAARLLGLGRTTTFRLVANGDIPSFKLGGRRFIVPSDLDAYISRQK